MEQLNLLEILRKVPSDTKLYSPIFGEVNFELDSTTSYGYPIRIRPYGAEGSLMHSVCLDKYGRYVNYCGECILFPSRDVHDWNNFKINEDKDDETTVLTEGRFRNRETGICYSVSIGSSGYLLTPLHYSNDPLVITGLSKEEILKNYERIDKFSTTFLRPFDRVLIRQSKYRVDYYETWGISLFEQVISYEEYKTINGIFEYCIPYNDETKHLVGTEDYLPKFYDINS